MYLQPHGFSSSLIPLLSPWEDLCHLHLKEEEKKFPKLPVTSFTRAQLMISLLLTQEPSRELSDWLGTLSLTDHAQDASQTWVHQPALCKTCVLLFYSVCLCPISLVLRYPLLHSGRMLAPAPRAQQFLRAMFWFLRTLTILQPTLLFLCLQRKIPFPRLQLR